jgi:uncharacterized protein (DUF433 family)
MNTALKGIVHGKLIELEREPGLPDGQEITVDIHPLQKQGHAATTEPAAFPTEWLERFDVDPAIKPGKFVVKGTRLLADDLVRLVEEGRTDDEIKHKHPELTVEDMNALRQYAQVPAGLRRACGAWADDADELDKYLEWNREQRKVGRKEIE